MNYTIFFTICSLFYSVLIGTAYFSKRRIKSVENKIFSWIIITNFIGIILELCCLITSLDYVKYSLINFITIRLYLIYLLTWIFIFTRYVITISQASETKFIKLFKKSLMIIYWILLILTFVLPISLKVTNNIAQYPYGPAVDLEYIVGALCSTICFGFLLKNIKNIKNKKYFPIFAFITGGLFIMLIQRTNPQLLLMTSMETFVTALMFFTIENPDVKMIEQLNMAKDEADKANRAKTDFLSSMSHEIRTPLNAIVGFSECINQAKTLDEAKENANDIISASGTLLELVNGILDISKIEAGKIEIHNSSYNSKDLFNSIVKLGKGRLGEKPLDFRVNIADDIPETLYGDHANLKKVIINILTNAIKYTEKGYIDLSIKCVKTNDICRLIVSVEDSGRGIKEEDIDKLFTKFQRLDEDRNTTIEGTGLGLAITKQLVDLMGGKIVVNSTFGEGSKFTIALDQKISKTQVVKQEVKEEISLDLSGRKILIVDDNKLNLKVASKILEKYNPIIETVESGMECLDKINSGNSYDLILMDDMMPRMTGSETLLRLKQIPNFNMPVIALTANAISGMEEKYIKDGFDGYLAKPIDKEKLHQVLVKFINERKQQNDVEQPVNNVVQEEISIENNDNLDLTGKKVLIVDDNKLNIKVANTFLKKYNPNIDEVLSGIECVNKIKEGSTYDLIFMDDMMPEQSGVETFHELEKLENFKIPVVALTANAIEGMREQYLSEGFDEYLSKPINKDELDRILKLIFKNNTAIMEQSKQFIQSDVKEEKIEEVFKKEELIEQKNIEHQEEKPIINKPNFEELPEELFEISNSELITKSEIKEEKIEEVPKKEELYKEKLETPKQFSPVYITKEENKNNVEYLKENNIDVNHGIELLGDIEMYNETMEEFYNNITERVNKLRTFKENNDLANYAIEAHALKSDSKYLGFTELAEKAFDHEIKAKSNDLEFISREFDRLLNSLNRILNIVKKYLGK